MSKMWVALALRKGVMKNLLYVNNEEIVKQHLRNLQQEVERFKFAQQVLSAQKELSKFNRKEKSTIKKNDAKESYVRKQSL
ncbi:MAG TPA: hypothetical protein VGI33_14850 [Paenibacillus sp.]